MSIEDFDQCTPSEFLEIAEAWQCNYRAGWEQTRALALCILQPYSQQELEPCDVMEFSWEKASPASRRRELTAEEKEAERKRYAAVKAARGLQ